MKYFNSLGIAALILTLFSLSGCKGKQTEQVEAQPTEDSSKVAAAVADTASSVSTPESSVFPIAYVNVDLLLLDYETDENMNGIHSYRPVILPKGICCLSYGERRDEKVYSQYSDRFQYLEIIVIILLLIDLLLLGRKNTHLSKFDIFTRKENAKDLFN